MSVLHLLCSSLTAEEAAPEAAAEEAAPAPAEEEAPAAAEEPAAEAPGVLLLAASLPSQLIALLFNLVGA